MRLILNLSLLAPPLTGIGYYFARLLPHLLDSPKVSDVHGFWYMKWLRSKQQIYDLLQHDILKSSTTNALSPLRQKELFWLRVLYFQWRKFCVQYGKPNDYKDWHYWEGGFLPFLPSPKLITIHDLSHLRYPEFHPRVRVRLLKHYLNQSIQDTKAILTVSEFSKSEIMELLGISASKIHVVPPAISTTFYPRSIDECKDFLKRYSLPYNGYFLSVATFEPRKNLQRLLDAYRNLGMDMKHTYPLVLVGASGWLNDKLKADIARCIKNENIRFLGYVCDDDMPLLFAAARVFVYLSLYEGYGMPIAEAQKSGITCVVSNHGAMLETAGIGAITADAYCSKSIANALEQAIHTPKRIYENPAILSPNDAAEKLLDVLATL